MPCHDTKKTELDWIVQRIVHAKLARNSYDVGGGRRRVGIHCLPHLTRLS